MIYGTLVASPWAAHDRTGAVVAADNPTSGGLARPHLPVTFASLQDPGDTTSSSTFAALQTAALYRKQHARMRLTVHVVTTAAAAEYRVTVGGAVIHGPVTVTQGRAITTTAAFAVPGQHMATLRLDIEARISSGAGTVGVRVLAGEGLPA